MQCALACLTCYADNGAKCKTCNESYSLLALSSGICYTCVDTNCRQCEAENASKCQVCDYGYVLDTTTDRCISCPSNCLSCSLLITNTTTANTTTNTNTTTITTSTSCYECTTAYALSSTGTCVPCAADCQYCLPSNPSVCLLCRYGKYLNYKTAVCQSCPNGCSRCRSND